MKKKLLSVLPLTVIAGMATSGCISTHRTEVLEPTGRTEVVATEPVTTTSTTRTVVVSPEPPPAPRTEVFTSPPAETDVWVSGYWDRADGKWVWSPGHWEARPTVNAVWVPGHWGPNPNGKGWLWTPGYWE